MVEDSKKISTIGTFLGVNIEDLTRDELIAVINELGRQLDIQYTRGRFGFRSFYKDLN